MILDGNDAKSIAIGAELIKGGELLGLPTETVYGLAADADNATAVAKIFKMKGRPADHPLIVHVLDCASVAHFAASVPDFAAKLIEAFWPGPLTLILPRREGVAATAAGGQDSIGLRCPSHPVAQALLQACLTSVGADAKTVWGMAAPSANPFGRVSPTTAQHVQDEFGDDLLILDGGACPVGIESTIIDCTRGQPVLLRPGAITPAQVQAVCGLKVLLKDEPQTLVAPAPRAAGTLASHYAPNATVRLMTTDDLQTALDLLAPDLSCDASGGKPRIAIYARTHLNTASRHLLCRRMPEAAEATARQLFAVLRDFDAQGVQQIWIESPPATPAWEGVRDRLLRASAS